MAKVVDQQLTGKIGDLIYKSWKGKPYVSRAPRKRPAPPSEAQLKRRKSFGIASSIGYSMLKIMVLRNYWEKANIDASSARGKFIKANCNRIINSGGISEVNLASEDNLVPVSLVLHNLTQSSLSCVFNIASVTEFCKSVSMQGIVQLEGPEEPGGKQIMCFPVVSHDYQVLTGEDITMDVRFTSQDTELVKRYKNINVLLNLAFKDLQGEVIQFSENKFI